MSRSLAKYNRFNRFDFIINSLIGAISGAFLGIYILDIFPGASIGFSLRQLRTGVIKCVRVRRSSDNTEQDFGFVNGYLDTVSLLSFVGGGDGFVKTWYDQSVNALDATEVTTALQPQIVGSGALLINNNKATIGFNQKRLILPATSLLTSGAGLWNAFMVVVPAATTGDRCIWSADDSGNGKRLAIFGKIASGSQETTTFDTLGNDYNDIDPSHPISVGNQYLFNGRRRATTIAIFTNGLTDGSSGVAGTAQVTNPIPTIGILNSTVINTITAFIGNIQEIIHFPDVDETKRVAVTAAIKAYYKIV
jgi:hypothetical protein